MYDCQICNQPVIATKAFEKLDLMADTNDVVACKECYYDVLKTSVVIEKARTNSAFLLEIHPLNN